MADVSVRISPLRRFLAYCLAGGVIGWAWSHVRHGGGPSAGSHSLREFVLSRAQASFPPGILISIALLCLFSLYWEAAAGRAAETKSQESRWSRSIHLMLVTAAQLLLLFPVPGLRARFLPDATGLVVAGIMLEILFLVLAVWARQLLGRNWSGAIAVKLDQQLIRSGPYRFVRHPIYSALLGAYASIAVISGELHALLGLLLVCVAYWRKIQLEEQVLNTLFGPVYKEYCSAVRAVIPRVL